MRTIDTQAGSLRVISLKTFLRDHIPARLHVLDQDSVHFNSLSNNSSNGSTVSEESGYFSDSTYVRCATPMLEGDREAAIWAGLLPQASFQVVFASNAREIAEKMAVESLMEFGDPTVLVRVSRRKWMAVNPNDFVAYFSNGKSQKWGGACVAQVRFVIFEIMDITEDEAAELVKLNQAQFGN